MALVAGMPVPVVLSPVQARSERLEISVPASSGDLAVNRLAARFGVNVVVVADLQSRQTPTLSGRYTMDEAFSRLLAPVGARAVRIGPGIYRVEVIPLRSPARSPTAPQVETAPTEVDDVIVTAPVDRGVLDGVNGRSTLDADGLLNRRGRSATETVATLSVTVESTRQGAGRSKLFIRGLADSALSGPLQATIGQYFDEIRLGFGVPDPDLSLVDVRRVEVFEGPQGSRFGSGSIGGIIRIDPELPDPTSRSGILAGALSTTRAGAPGGDASLVVNTPLGLDSAARLVLYGRRDGGFVDTADRGADADSIDVLGARVGYQRAGPGWTMNLVAISQGVSARDTPVTADPAQLRNHLTTAQPYEGDFSLAGASFSRKWSDVRLTSTASASRQTLDETFDASVPAAGVTASTVRRQRADAASVENRVELDPGAGWRVNSGFSLIGARTRSDRSRADGSGRVDRVEVERVFQEAALFGEVVATPLPAHSVSIGGRVAQVRIDTDITAPNGPTSNAPAESDFILTPSLGWRWTTGWGGEIFARYEEGIRPGDVSEAQGFGRPYGPDRVRLIEAGASNAANRAWRLEASVGLIDWRDIQSDTITIGGDLVTDNIGDGRIAFARVAGAWNPTSDLHLFGALFLNRSELRLSGPSLIGIPESVLPNVAPVSGRLGIDYGPIPIGGGSLTVGGHLRYIGRSTPGLGPGLDTPQGGYADTELSARLDRERHSLVLSITNLFEISAPRFSIGAPYRLYEGGVVPLRPLSVRFGIEKRF